MVPFARPGDRRTGPVSPVPTSANGTGGTRRPSAPRTRRPSSPVRRPPRHGEPPPRLGVSGRRPVTPNVRPGPRNRTSGATTRRPTVCRRFPRRRLRRSACPEPSSGSSSKEAGDALTAGNSVWAGVVRGLRGGLPRSGAVRVVFPPPPPRSPALPGSLDCALARWAETPVSGSTAGCTGVVLSWRTDDGRRRDPRAPATGLPALVRPGAVRRAMSHGTRTRRPSRQHRRRGPSAVQGFRDLVPARILWRSTGRLSSSGSIPRRRGGPPRRSRAPGTP